MQPIERAHGRVRKARHVLEREFARTHVAEHHPSAGCAQVDGGDPLVIRAILGGLDTLAGARYSTSGDSADRVAREERAGVSRSYPRPR